MLVKGIALEETYKHYILRQVKELVEQIPAEHRQALAELIKARSLFFGCKDKDILETALGYLTKEGSEDNG